MTTVFLVIHLILAVALVTVILLQRSDGGALGGLSEALHITKLPITRPSGCYVMCTM